MKEVASRVFGIAYLSLTLFVTKVFANDHDATLAANNFALIANLLHAWINLHVVAPLLLITINNSTFCEVIWAHFHNHTICRQNANVVLSHLSADVREYSVPVC